MREVLIESRQRYKDLVEISSDFAWETDAAGKFVFVSPKGVLGWSPDELLGRSAADFLALPDPAQVFAATAPVIDAEISFRRRDGSSARLSVAALPVRDGAGRLLGARGLARDVTPERDREHALAHAHLRDRLFTRLVRALRDELEPEAALAAAIAAVGPALGAAGGLILRRVGDEAGAAAQWGEPLAAATLARAQAALGQAEACALVLADWHVIGHVARYRQGIEGALLLWRQEVDGGFAEADRQLLADLADQLGVVIAQVAQHERILSLSRTDPLTGLLNRRAFFVDLARCLRRSRPARRGGALLYLDLDNFKRVNDRHGHAAGDRAIAALAEILRRAVRAGDVAARLGGDEFALWLDGVDAEAAQARGEEVLAASWALARFSDEAEHPLGVSIGLAVAREDEAPEPLVARADAAMYRAKHGGKGHLVVAALAEEVPA